MLKFSGQLVNISERDAVNKDGQAVKYYSLVFVEKKFSLQANTNLDEMFSVSVPKHCVSRLPEYRALVGKNLDLEVSVKSFQGKITGIELAGVGDIFIQAAPKVA